MPWTRGKDSFECFNGLATKTNISWMKGGAVTTEPFIESPSFEEMNRRFQRRKDDE
jgi:hypothetical protein